MRKADVIQVLKDNEAAIRALGVGSLYLYGSHARDEATPQSDVDLFFDRDQNTKLGLIELARLQFMLVDALGTEVDVGTRTSLHPVLVTGIEASAIKVF